jgi:two-component system response regulator GlrR
MSDNQSSFKASGPALSDPAAGLGLRAAPSTLAQDGPPGRSRRSDRIILASSESQQAVDQATMVARSNSPLLIVGPDGSGRKHIARAIHEWSQRAGAPVVVISAGGTPAGLQARELFGALPEADPLAAGGTAGALADSGEGTLVIERVDLLSAPVRHRLVEAMREGHFRGEGALETTPLRCRVVATADSGADGVLGETPVQVVTLRALTERQEDILPLAAHFLSEFADEEGLSAVGFTVDARRWLIEEPWNGNVRELRERIRQAVGLSGSGSISAEALMLSTEGDEVPSFKEAKRAFETRYVEGLLRRCSGNISRAARLAKKDRKDFYDVIRRTGVDPTQFRS